MEVTCSPILSGRGQHIIKSLAPSDCRHAYCLLTTSMDYHFGHEHTDRSELHGREARSWEVRAPLVDTIKFWCASCASPAGQAWPAWQERNGIERSRPEIGTWVSPAARGPLLHSLSDQYKYTTPCSPSRPAQVPAQVPAQGARIGGAGLCATSKERPTACSTA